MSWLDEVTTATSSFVSVVANVAPSFAIVVETIKQLANQVKIRLETFQLFCSVLLIVFFFEIKRISNINCIKINNITIIIINIAAINITISIAACLSL